MSEPDGDSKGKGVVVGGCILAAIGLPVLAAVLAVLWFLSTTPGKQARGAAASAARLWKEGMEGPGARALQKGSCDRAFVLDFETLMKLMPPGAKVTGPTPELIVLCGLENTGGAPSCDDVARVYLKHGRPPRKDLGVIVSDRAGSPLCARLYDPHGTPLGPYTGAIPRPPAAGGP